MDRTTGILWAGIIARGYTSSMNLFTLGVKWNRRRKNVLSIQAGLKANTLPRRFYNIPKTVQGCMYAVTQIYYFIKVLSHITG